MKAEIILILLALITTLRAHKDSIRDLQASSYTVTASRSSQLGSLCTNTNRNSLYNQYGISGNVKYMPQFAKFYTLDSTIFNLFLDLDLIAINDQLRADTLPYLAYVVPAFIGPALLIFITPFLLVCLCCPSRCCLRKKLQYTNCQKMWPVVFTVLLTATIITTCFVGLFSNYKIHDGYQELSCSGIIGVDDALYGSSNYNGDAYFSGVQTINNQLQILTSGSFNSILGNLSSVSSASNSTSNALGLLNAALYNISVIPDASTSNLNLNYNTPFTSDVPTGTIASNFPSILGSITSNQTLVGSAYSSTNAAYNNISSITSTVDSFQSSSSAFLNSINQLINATAQSSASLKSTLLTVNDMLTTQNYFTNVYYLERLFYGIIIGLVICYLLALIAFACCGKLSCRSLLHLLCFFIFFATIGVFAAFLILTYSSSIFYSGCKYLNQSINDPNTFITNMKKLGISSTVATQYSVCLAGQSGDILSQISGQQNKNYLDNLKFVMNNITSLNGIDLHTKINSAYSPLTLTLQNYANSNTLDITDTSSIQQLNYISLSSNFNCTKGGFNLDSWIPSIHQSDPAIKCKSPSGMPNSDNSTCTSSNNFNTVANGCFGCMDTFSLLYGATSQATAFSILNGRYVGCSVFNTQLANIWNNYYLIKKNVLGQVLAREYTARQSVQTARQSITNNLQPTFQRTINQLYSISPSILTPNYGMLWGLNCKVIGQDMILFQQVACANTFSYSYFHRILCAIVAYGLLVLQCCNTCIIFRRRKQILQVKNRPNKNRAQPYIDPLSDGRLQNHDL